jgi:hypothetical protein
MFARTSRLPGSQESGDRCLFDGMQEFHTAPPTRLHRPIVANGHLLASIVFLKSIALYVLIGICKLDRSWPKRQSECSFGRCGKLW